MTPLFRISAACIATVAFITAPLTYARQLRTFGIAVADVRPDLFSDITSAFARAAAGEGIGVVRLDARESVPRQIRQIRSLIARRVDAVIYVPAGAVLSGVPVRDARAAGIPIVAVYGTPLDSPADTFIGTDNVAATRTLGRYICAVTRGRAKVAMIRGVTGMAPEVERTKGFNESVSRCPGLSVVAEAPSSWSRADGVSIASDMLKRHPDITVIFGQSDLLALGAADAVRNARVGHRVEIFGFDGDLAGLKAVQSGILEATMAHRSRRMGTLALRSATDLAARRPVPKVQLQSAILVTKVNAASLISTRP